MEETPMVNMRFSRFAVPGCRTSALGELYTWTKGDLIYS